MRHAPRPLARRAWTCASATRPLEKEENARACRFTWQRNRKPWGALPRSTIGFGVLPRPCRIDPKLGPTPDVTPGRDREDRQQHVGPRGDRRSVLPGDDVAAEPHQMGQRDAPLQRCHPDRPKARREKVREVEPAKAAKSTPNIGRSTPLKRWDIGPTTSRRLRRVRARIDWSIDPASAGRAPAQRHQQTPHSQKLKPTRTP